MEQSEDRQSWVAQNAMRSVRGDSELDQLEMQSGRKKTERMLDESLDSTNLGNTEQRPAPLRRPTQACREEYHRMATDASSRWLRDSGVMYTSIARLLPQVSPMFRSSCEG